MQGALTRPTLRSHEAEARRASLHGPEAIRGRAQPSRICFSTMRPPRAGCRGGATPQTAVRRPNPKGRADMRRIALSRALTVSLG